MESHDSDTELLDAKSLTQPEMEFHNLQTEIVTDPTNNRQSSPVASVAKEQVILSSSSITSTNHTSNSTQPLPSTAVISLLSDSGSDSDVEITHTTSRTAAPSTYSSLYYYSSSSSSPSSSSSSFSSSTASSSENEPSRKRTPEYEFFPPQKRRQELKTGSWSYRDRMRFVGALQRGTDLIALARSMHRDVDDVFEKFSDVVAAGLYQCGVRDEATQTGVEE